MPRLSNEEILGLYHPNALKGKILRVLLEAPSLTIEEVHEAIGDPAVSVKSVAVRMSELLNRGSVERSVRKPSAKSKQMILSYAIRDSR